MTFDSKLVSDEHPELFHYTTVEAFKNIYERKNFHATHYKNLLDSSELWRFSPIVKNFIRPTILKVFEQKMQDNAQLSHNINSEGGINAVVDQEAAMHLEVLHQNTFGVRGLPETFICSFCTHDADTDEAHDGLLSQWRGYAAGGGVAIVLNTRKIEERMRQEQKIFAYPLNHIGNIKYDNDDVEIKKDFCKVFDNFPKMLHAFYSDKKEDTEATLLEIFDHFIYGSTLVKHHAFHEENEVRIVVSLQPTDPNSIFKATPEQFDRKRKEVKYKTRGDSEVRYIELFGDEKLPITRVIVGPSRFQNFNYQTISELLSKEDPSLKVEKSNTPFIG